MNTRPTLLKSAFGSVRPYTRHVNGCANTDDSCRCPKWLYENCKGCAPRRYTLTTPSWADAQRLASDKLRSFDPEIAAARAVTEKRSAGLLSLEAAFDVWIKRTETKFGTDATVLRTYRSVKAKAVKWARREHIDYVQDITPLHLTEWQSSRDWLKLADTTRKQQWAVLRSIFAYWKNMGVLESNPIAGIATTKTAEDHVQGPYAQEQVDDVFAHVDQAVPVNIPAREREAYAPRLRAFITLLLHTGCDVIDAVLFDQTRLQDMQINGNGIVPVYRYRRVKTDVQAVIPLTADVTSILRSVPMLHDNREHMPFRDPRIKVASEAENWSRRVGSVLDRAGVKHVELPRGRDGKPRRKPANAKQFRHTFAVRQLVKGLRPEVVARQLGHVDATMVRKHYAPWVPELDESHIREILAAQ